LIGSLIFTSREFPDHTGFQEGVMFQTPVSGVQTYFSPESCGTNWRSQQVPHPNKAVSGDRKGEHPPNFQDTAIV
jgi:hypothetical protein